MSSPGDYDEMKRRLGANKYTMPRRTEMPARVRIGPHVWRVKRQLIDGDPNAYGVTQERALRILIAPDCHRSQDRRGCSARCATTRNWSAT